MTEKARSFVFVVIIAVPLLVSSRSGVDPAPTPGSGEEWLSWTQQQRVTYVRAFTAGYTKGARQACLGADFVFEVGQPHRLGDERHESDVPSARCLAQMDWYSKAIFSEARQDFSAYTEVLTDFYRMHREYRRIPFDYLMQFLTDRQYKTSNQLYEMALKGQIRTMW